MGKLLVGFTAALVTVVVLSPAARADTKIVTITDGLTGKVNVAPNPVNVNEGDSVTFQNEASAAYAVCITSNNMQLLYVNKGSSGPTPRLAAGTLAYYLAKSDCSASATHSADGTIDIAPAPTTTEPPTTTATTAPSTTAASTTTTSTTSTSTTTSTTSTTSTTTSTTPPTTTVSGKGGSSNTPWVLGILALVVAALAALAYAAYRRSQGPPYDDPEGWDSPDDWDDGPPPTQVGPTV